MKIRFFGFLFTAAALGSGYYYLNHGRSSFMNMPHVPSFGTGANSYGAGDLGIGAIGGVGSQYGGIIPTTGGAEVEHKPDSTPLIIAAASGDKEEVAKRLKTLPVDGRDSNRRTALMGAAYHGYNEICEKLLAAGANISLQDNQGFNALDFAASRGLVDTVALLLKESDRKDYNFTLEYAQLMQAAFASDIALLPPGKNTFRSINRITPEGKSPLHVVASGSAVELARAMIGRGANVNLSNADNQKPLHWAAWNNQLFMMSLLIKHGADIDARDGAGSTALMLAAEHGQKEAVLLLLEKNANRKLRNKAHETAEDIAGEKGFQEIVAILRAP